MATVSSLGGLERLGIRNVTEMLTLHSLSEKGSISTCVAGL